MTVIIWIKHKWDVYLASDWRTSEWDFILSDKSVKQFSSHWCIFATCWSVRLKNAFQYVLQVQLQDLKTTINTNNDIYAIYNMFYKHLRDTWMIDVWEVLNFWVIIITESWKLFSLDWVWTVIEYQDYVCDGSWWPAADVLLSQIIIKNPATDIKFVMKEVFKRHSWTWGKVTINVFLWKKTKSLILKKVKHVNIWWKKSVNKAKGTVWSK